MPYVRRITRKVACGAVRIFSGIQPTGRKHLGNYIGAIRSTSPARTAATGDLLHRRPARDHGRLRARPSCASASTTRTAILLAAGLDPERCILFRQGDVHEHTELCLAARGVTAYGELNRMTPVQGEVGAAARAGLRRAVPLSGAAGRRRARLPRHEVPVGEDQRQHIELMRDVARALQRALRRDARRARAAASRRSARGSWTCRTRRARCRRPAAPSRARSTCSTSRRRSRRRSRAR